MEGWKSDMHTCRKYGIKRGGAREREKGREREREGGRMKMRGGGGGSERKRECMYISIHVPKPLTCTSFVYV